jgi:phosphoglycerate kinase
LLENLHFWSEELEPNLDFAKKLATMADVYINEAFGSCHRNEASMVLLPSLLPHAAGIHLEKEVSELSKLLKDPKRPFVAIVGGAKIETKLPVIENLAKVADSVLVGGKIAKEFQISNFKFPISNVIVATSAAGDKDIDQKSIDKFGEVIATAKTIVWNGPMGVFEEGFDKGTKAVAQAIIESGVYSVVGGGETTEFLASEDLLSKFSFVSSGGGAMLEFLAGKELPGIKALE